ERAAVLSADGQLDVCRAVLPDCRFGACHGQRLHGASTERRAGLSSDLFVWAALLCLERGGWSSTRSVRRARWSSSLACSIRAGGLEIDAEAILGDATDPSDDTGIG
ncbi:MAG TPA: hypothetical protein VF515_04740, partial [Candidatus Binatia bacterium]